MIRRGREVANKKLLYNVLDNLNNTKKVEQPKLSFWQKIKGWLRL